MGEAPPLIISVDLGGGNWLEQVIGAAGMVVGWDGMGWSGSCRRGSGAGSLGLKMVVRLAAAGGGGWDRGSSAFDHPR